MIKSIRAHYVLFAIVFGWTATAPVYWIEARGIEAWADVSVTLKLDRREAALADSVEMVVEVSGARESDAEPAVEGLESFGVTRRGTASRVQIINGRMSSGVDYTYFIYPNKTGTFRIGPARIEVGGKTFESDTAALTVTESSTPPGQSRGAAFLTAAISSNEAHVEEQVIYTLKLYHQVKVKDLSLGLPETEYLAFKQLGEPSEYGTSVDGEVYRILEVRYALTALKAGDYDIAPSRLKMTVLQPRRGPRRGRSEDPFFSDPFLSFTEGRPLTVGSEPVELSVLPLPEAGRPADFSGLVGSFQMESTLAPAEVKAGESATLTVILRGHGNVNRMPDLKAPESGGAKIYADQPILETSADQEGLAGVKTMKWAVVPEREGRYEIPPLAVSFFDPKAREYRAIQSPRFSLSVLPGETKRVDKAAGGSEGSGPEGSAKEAVKALGRDILPAHTSLKDLTTGRGLRPRGPAFWLVLGLPLLVYVLVFWGRKLARKSPGALAAARRRKAAAALIGGCRRGRLSSSELAEAVRRYLNDRFGLSMGSLTPDEAARVLESRGAGRQTADKLRTLAQRLEDAIYTGRGDGPCGAEPELIALVKALEKEVK